MTYSNIFLLIFQAFVYFCEKGSIVDNAENWLLISGLDGKVRVEAGF